MTQTSSAVSLPTFGTTSICPNIILHDHELSYSPKTLLCVKMDPSYRLAKGTKVLRRTLDLWLMCTTEACSLLDIGFNYASITAKNHGFACQTVRHCLTIVERYAEPKRALQKTSGRPSGGHYWINRLVWSRVYAHPFFL